MRGPSSQPNSPWAMNHQGQPAVMMAPTQPQHQNRAFVGEEWNMKPVQQGSGMTSPQQRPGPGMQTAPCWDSGQGWQGQLGPNLMPMTGGPDNSRLFGAQSLPGGGGAMQNPQNMREPPMQNMQNMQNMREPQLMQNMHNQNMREPAVPNIREFPMQNMQNMREPPMQNMREMPIQRMPNNMQGPPLPPMHNASQLPGGNLANMQMMQEPPVNMQNMQNMRDMRGGGMQHMQGLQGGLNQMPNMYDMGGGGMPNGMPNVRELPVGSMPPMPMQNMPPMPPMQNMPPMHNMQNDMGLHSAHVGQEMLSRPPKVPPPVDAPILPPAPVPPMNNMQSPLMQVIALPAGAPPPQGAIAMLPGQAPPPGAIPMMPGTMPEHVQMIAVPLGEAPPAGAVPVGDAQQVLTARTSHSDSTTTSTIPENRRTSNKAFKIKDPRTGLEVSAPEKSEAASDKSRRMRIVNPKTGEEVF